MYARREDAMRIGLLGAGRIGRIHGGNIAAHPRASLAAVADAVKANPKTKITSPNSAKNLYKLSVGRVGKTVAIISDLLYPDSFP